jgi:tryptophan 2,3-dioxygenase
MSQQPDAPGAGPETPNLDFQGTTPYEDHVRADVLTHLRNPLSDDPGELVFLVTRRATPAEPGTGGSAGVAWLERRARQQVLPELWTARSHV